MTSPKTMVDPTKRKIFDVAEYLDTNESISIYLDEAYRSNDPHKIAHALEVVATAKGMTAIAKKSGVPRDELFRKIINEDHPTMDFLLPILRRFGVKTNVQPAVPASHIIKPQPEEETEHVSLLGSRLWMRFFNGLSSTPTNS